MLAATLGRDRCHRTLYELEQRLLHPLPRYVAGYRGVVGLSGNLVYFIDVHDARLRLLDIVVTLLEKLLNDVLHVLADVACFRQSGCIRDGEMAR